MAKIRFKDLDGWLKFAAVGAIINAGFASLLAAATIIGLLLGIFA